MIELPARTLLDSLSPVELAALRRLSAAERAALGLGVSALAPISDEAPEAAKSAPARRAGVTIPTAARPLIRMLRIWFTAGLTKYRNALSEPPVSGWHGCFVVGSLDAEMFLVLDPCSLRSWTLKADAPEIATGIENQSWFKPNGTGRVRDQILAAWDSAARRAIQPPDLGLAAFVLNRMGFILSPTRRLQAYGGDAVGEPAGIKSESRKAANLEHMHARRAEPDYRSVEARRKAAKRAVKRRKIA